MNFLKEHWKSILTGVFVVALIISLKFIPLQQWFDPFFEWTKQMGWLGVFAFIFVGILSTLCMLPASIFVFSSGLIFGFWEGVAVAFGILISSCSLGYLAGTKLWDRIERFAVFQNDLFAAIRQALEKEGAYLVGLLRMTPFLHFTIGNLFFGSLSFRFWPYLLASALGMIPGTLLIVYTGHLSRQSISSGSEQSIWNIVFLVVGILIFGTISWWITHKTKNILNEQKSESTAQPFP